MSYLLPSSIFHQNLIDWCRHSATHPSRRRRAYAACRPLVTGGRFPIAFLIVSCKQLRRFRTIALIPIFGTLPNVHLFKKKGEIDVIGESLWVINSFAFCQLPHCQNTHPSARRQWHADISTEWVCVPRSAGPRDKGRCVTNSCCFEMHG